MKMWNGLEDYRQTLLRAGRKKKWQDRASRIASSLPRIPSTEVLHKFSLDQLPVVLCSWHDCVQGGTGSLILTKERKIKVVLE